MTLNFFDWTRPLPVSPAMTGIRRPRLVAHWRRGADGRLECLWESAVPIIFLR